MCKCKSHICIVVCSWIYPNYSVIVSSVFIASSIDNAPSFLYIIVGDKKDFDFRILKAIKRLFLPSLSKQGLPYPASGDEWDGVR